MSEPTGTPEKDPPRPGLVAGLAIAACVLLMLLVLAMYRFLGGFNTISSETAKWNDFGVYFGGVLGPSLSALTLAAVVYTLVLQIRQLEASDKEKAILQGRLDAATAVQRDTAKGLSDQLKMTREHAAVSTFFEMVRLQHELTDGLRHGNLAGRGALMSIYLHLKNFYTGFAGARPHAPQQPSVAEHDKLVFDLYLRESNFEFAHYFSNLWQIFKYVQESEIADKQRFADIVRSQMTAYELGLLFYYASSSYGSEIKPLLSTYGTFKYMTPDILFNINSARNLPGGAWGGKFLVTDPD